MSAPAATAATSACAADPIDLATWEGLALGKNGGKLVTERIRKLQLLQATGKESVLDLSNCELKDGSIDTDGTIAAGELAKMQQLAVLYVHGNKLSSLADLLFSLPKLRMINCSNNKLAKLNASALANAKELQEFYVSKNSLEELPDALFVDLPKLRRFNCTGNDISGVIPASIGHAQALEEFVCRNNELISGVPAELGRVTTLKKLWMQGCSEGTLEVPLAALQGLASDCEFKHSGIVVDGKKVAEDADTVAKILAAVGA